MDSRFIHINKKDTPRGKIYNNSYYPEIKLDDNDIYVQCTSGDRLDNLANQFYNNPNLYWIILSANPDVEQYRMSPKAGTILRIPINVIDIIEEYIQYNKG